MADVPRDEPPEDTRPWEELQAVRRDSEPHRGHVLLWLATGSLACGLAGPFLGAPGLVGAVLGVVARRLAEHDLAAMRDGSLDPSGRGQAERALRRADQGIALSVLGMMTCGPLWLLATRLIAGAVYE